MVEATRFEPPVTAVTKPFWEATKDRRLTLQWCRDCQQPVWFPREVCPRCLGSALEWRDSPGRGTVYACSVEYKPRNPAMAGPYVVALIELDEGVRMLSNVVGCPPESVAIGDRVTIDWEELSDGRHLPQFAPKLDGGRPE